MKSYSQIWMGILAGIIAGVLAMPIADAIIDWKFDNETFTHSCYCIHC